jgi:soluble lytic murein transglycosylase-like protein
VRHRIPPLILILAWGAIVPVVLAGSWRGALPGAARPVAEPLAAALDSGRTLRNAAAAMRHHDCAAARREVAPLAAAAGPDRGLANLVAGLYAHACEDVVAAEERLFAARGGSGLLEDWRLYLLSDSAHARGHVLVAKVALAKLLGDYPSSPLRPRAMARAAAFAWEQADATTALALIRQARKEGAGGEERTRLDSLAWEIGGRLGDRKVSTEAARELLIGSPLVASQLGVVEVFRRPDGIFQWSDALSEADLRRRAQALLALQLEPAALATLDAVAPADRDLRWVLLKAEVLTRAHRGQDALELLRPLQSSDAPAAARGSHAKSRAEREMQPLLKGQQMAALEWALAQADDDLAAMHRGRTHAAQAERHKLRLAARLHLNAAAQMAEAGGTGDPGLATRALRALYSHLIEEDLFDQAVAALRRLHALDPKDTTGAGLLWGRGWQDLIHRNYTGAIGYWSELRALYPGDSSGRRAHYWIGRSYEALGQPERARAIYTELAAADTSDFYRRNAVIRLARWKAAAPPRSDAPPAEPWPYDPALVRAQLLSDLGLDALAQVELDLVRDRAQPRPVAALQAVILARQGDRRRSVLAIHEAFPALGGPLQAAVPEEALKLYYPLEYEQPIRAAAAANGLAPALVFAVIRQESAFDASAQSRAGASGLMQLMPGTARELARGLGLGWSRDRLGDPAWNVQVGTSYLHQVIAMFGGNIELALAGYNGGPYRIKRLWHEAGDGDLDRFLEGLTIEESKVYVKRILVLSDSYHRLYPHAAG